MHQETKHDRTWRAVVNHEEQYALWPAGKAIPSGWRDTGRTGPKADVLRYIEEIWTDMRPASVRLRSGSR